ncbi:MAG TPA: tyrosine-type recombinase/integrase [Saprospiraceae bacterium]|nr:tyrosine-type recombinase/integrase [Saprospiraceae bacterium]HRG68381.1 tyrosine-type recombinase/integrase [Saprospiraceae bacterium]
MDIEILSQNFCDYSQSIRGFSKHTIRRYRNVIKRYCQFANICEISQVNEDNVRALFYHGRTERKWSVNTFLVYHKTLLVFFRWCIIQGYMKKNPITDIEKPKMEKRLPVKLNKQVSLRLLEVVYNYPYEYRFLRYRNHAIFSTFIFTGLRKQELLNLKYTDIDTDNFTIFVKQGKGNKDRIVPMSYTLAQSLKRYQEERKRLNKTNPEFFSSLRGNVGFTDNGLKKLVDQVRKSSGVSFTVHKLRHTFATLMLEGGCDIYSLSKMMGHSDIKTTTIYLSASAEHLRGQMVKHPLNNLV